LLLTAKEPIVKVSKDRNKVGFLLNNFAGKILSQKLDHHTNPKLIRNEK